MAGKKFIYEQKIPEEALENKSISNNPQEFIERELVKSLIDNIPLEDLKKLVKIGRKRERNPQAPTPDNFANYWYNYKIEITI